MTTERVIECIKTFTNQSTEFLSAKFIAYNLYITERQLRKLCEEIRENDLAKGYVLISGNDGYKLSNDAEEINAWLNRYLGAAFTQINVAKQAKRFLNEKQLQGIQTKLEL